MRKELYKLIGIFLVGVVITIVIYQLSLLEHILQLLLQLGPLGPLIAGAFFVPTVTIATGGSLLSSLSETQNIAYVALWGGLGGAIGDFLFFHIIKNIRRRLSRDTGSHKIVSIPHIFSRIEHSPLGRFMLPALGAIIIASPLPDEIGIALLGISNMKRFYFFLLSFTLNTIGIYLFLLGISLFR